MHDVEFVGAGGPATTGLGSPRIVREPLILGGEPSVKGTRISVRSIVQTAQLYGDLERVRRAFPTLDPADIDAAMRFYQENRDEVERYILENEADDSDN